MNRLAREVADGMVLALAVHHQLGHHPAHHRGELEPMAAESGGPVQAVGDGGLVQVFVLTRIIWTEEQSRDTERGGARFVERSGAAVR